MPQEIGRPGKPALAQPGFGKAGVSRTLKDAIDGALIIRRRGAGEGERDRPQAEIEQAIAEPRLVVVVALGLCVGDDGDLPVIEAEALVHGAQLRLGRLGVRQKDPARAAFDDRGGDGGALDVGERLGGEDHRDVLLAQGLQPFADTAGESRIVEKYPRLIEDEQDGRTVEALLEAAKQVAQHRQHGGARRA